MRIQIWSPGRPRVVDPDVLLLRLVRATPAGTVHLARCHLDGSVYPRGYILYLDTEGITRCPGAEAVRNFIRLDEQERVEIQ